MYPSDCGIFLRPTTASHWRGWRWLISKGYCAKTSALIRCCLMTRRFLKIQKRIALIIAALTVLAVGGAWLLGIPVLSLLYPNLRTGLSQCRPALVLIIFGGALNAYMNLFYYSLVIMKKQKYIFGVYGLVSLMAVLVSTPFVRLGR